MKRKEKHHSNHERWLISYADFITLLFAFFVVMYATSKADQKKQAQAAASINSAFQAMGLFQAAHGQQAVVVPVVAQEKSPADVQQDLENIKKHLEGLLSDQIAKHVVALHIGPDGLVISLREAGFFDSGSATPHPDSVKTIDEIADALSKTPYDIRIEGHTDNVPIHTDQFDSNWELSTARATHMTRLFIVGHRFSPERLSASGYAEFHPAASNATADGRSQNRRVDIIVLPRITVEPAKSADVPAMKAPAIATAIASSAKTADSSILSR